MSDRWRPRLDEMARAEIAFFERLEVAIRSAWRGFCAWCGDAWRTVSAWAARRRIRRVAQAYAFGRWLRLALRPRTDARGDGDTMEMAMQQRFLSGTPFDPVRLIAGVLGVWAVVATSFAVLFGLQASDARRELAQSERSAGALEQAVTTVAGTNAGLAERATAAEQEVVTLQARIAELETAGKQNLGEFARRERERAAARARTQQRQRELVNGANDDGGGVFDADRWLRERAAAAAGGEGDAPVPGVPPAAAPGPAGP